MAWIDMPFAAWLLNGCRIEVSVNDGPWKVAGEVHASFDDDDDIDGGHRVPMAFGV